MQEATKYIRTPCQKEKRWKPIVRLTLIRRKCYNAPVKTGKRPPITQWYIS